VGAVESVVAGHPAGGERRHHRSLHPDHAPQEAAAGSRLSQPIDPRIEKTIAHFCEIYLGGIPPIITNDSAFLSFLCILTGTEALAGYRFGAEKRNSGERFNQFVRAYYPADYHPFTHTDAQYADGRRWFFRCRAVHGFSPAGFALIHHHGEVHLQAAGNGNPILNAEDFFAALSLLLANTALNRLACVEHLGHSHAVVVRRQHDHSAERHAVFPDRRWGIMADREHQHVAVSIHAGDIVRRELPDLNARRNPTVLFRNPHRLHGTLEMWRIGHREYPRSHEGCCLSGCNGWALPIRGGGDEEKHDRDQSPLSIRHHLCAPFLTAETTTCD
jgi:hypothetical protein